jgi:hypothetical protein
MPLRLRGLERAAASASTRQRRLSMGDRRRERRAVAASSAEGRVRSVFSAGGAARAQEAGGRRQVMGGGQWTADWPPGLWRPRGASGGRQEACDANGYSGVSMREREPGRCGALPGAGANEVERGYGDLSSKHYPYPNHQGRQSYHPGARSDPSWGPPTPLTILLRVPTLLSVRGGFKGEERDLHSDRDTL